MEGRILRSFWLSWLEGIESFDTIIYGSDDSCRSSAFHRDPEKMIRLINRAYYRFSQKVTFETETVVFLVLAFLFRSFERVAPMSFG